jgi:hypothetical protein
VRQHPVPDSVRSLAPGRGRAFLGGLWGVLAVVLIASFPRPVVEPGWPVAAVALLVAMGVLAGFAAAGDPIGRWVALLGGGLAAYAAALVHVRTVADLVPWAVSTLSADRWREGALVSMAILGLALTAGFALGVLRRTLLGRWWGVPRDGVPLIGLSLAAIGALGVVLLFARAPLIEREGIQVQSVVVGMESVEADPPVLGTGATSFRFTTPSSSGRQWSYIMLEGPAPILSRLAGNELVTSDEWGTWEVSPPPGESAGWYATVRPGDYAWQLISVTFDAAAETSEHEVLAAAPFEVIALAAPSAPPEPPWVAPTVLVMWVGVLGLHFGSVVVSAGWMTTSGPARGVRAGVLAVGLTALLWFLGMAWVQLAINPL